MKGISMFNYIKKYINKITYVSLCLFVMVCAYLYFSNKNKQDQIDILKSNFKEVYASNSKLSDYVILTLKEKEERYEKRTDSILKKLGIPIRRVERTIENNYHYSYKDTVINNMIVNKDEWILDYNKGCYKFKCVVNPLTKKYSNVESSFDEKVLDIFYKDREPKKFLFWEWKLFSPLKSYHTKIFVCDSTKSETKEIIFEK